MFILAYLQYVEKVRKDVTVYDDIGCIFKNIYGEDFLQIPRSERDIIRNEKQKAVIDKTQNTAYIPLVGGKREFITFYKKEQCGILYKIKKDKV